MLVDVCSQIGAKKFTELLLSTLNHFNKTQNIPLFIILFNIMLFLLNCLPQTCNQLWFYDYFSVSVRLYELTLDY